MTTAEMATNMIRGTERPEWLTEATFPFESRYIEIGSSQIHYVDEGRGPIILFLHSNGVWSFLYRELIRGLRDRFRCIALDLPGFGLSTAGPSHDHSFLADSGILEAFVEDLDLSDITLFLHDTAGPIGLDVASRNPERIRGLVLSSTFGFPLKGYPEAELFLKLLGWRFPGHFLVDAFNILVLTLVMPGSPGVKRRKFTKQEKAAYYGPYKKRSSRRPINILFASLLRGYDYLAELEERLSKLADLPVLLLPGEKSGEIELGYPERFGKIFPNSRTEILHGAAHFTPEDAPMEIVAAIRRWWDEEAGKAE